MYYYDRLKSRYKNLSIATFDWDNIYFLKKYYPFIKKAEFIPFMGFQATGLVPYRERSRDILFVGSYNDLELSRKALDSLPGVFRTVGENAFRILENNTKKVDRKGGVI